MNRQQDKKAIFILFLIGIVPVIWIGLKLAPSANGGLAAILPALLEIFDNPFDISVCKDSLKTVLVLLLAYALAIGVYYSSQKNYRHGEEHGSAKWGDKKVINKKYEQEPKENNKIMTQNVSVGLDSRQHFRNLNTLVIGGSGAGKTRFYCKPNLLQANTSFVVLDPKGENLRDTGNLLKMKGYDIKVLDLINTILLFI